jgi:hypothetical protein
MSTFRRGLSPDAFRALAAMAEDPSDNWWKDLLALWSPSGASAGSRPLRLAVRDGYLNLYLRGQSIAKVGFNRRAGPFAEVHVKYAFADAREQTYARLSGVGFAARKVGREGSYAGLSTLLEWMGRASRWETPEKVQVERFTADNPRIIDLEMGLPAHAERATPLRIDAVALEPTLAGAQVVFWEAKRVTDGRVRSQSERPEVVDQVGAYTRYLSDDGHEAAVVAAYRETCRSLLEFASMAGPSCVRSLDPLIRGVAEGCVDLTVDRTPRLVIFGTDAELRHPAWRAHQAKLTQLGVPLLTLRSDPYRLPDVGTGT